MAAILLVDDDAALLDVLELSLQDAGHTVTTATDGALAMQAAAKAMPDLILSDVNMPRVDGFALVKRLRDQGVRVPVILLTSRDSEIDEALGLELGADDYVHKPFSTRVLLARVASLLRRESVRDAGAQDDADVTVGLLTLRPARLEVRYRGVGIVVTVTEFKLLEALTRRPGVVLSRERLMELARGDDSVVAERIIDTYVRRLRRKFEEVDSSFQEIETVVGAGYAWKPRSA